MTTRPRIPPVAERRPTGALPIPGDERRVPSPSARTWWAAILAGDATQVSAWLAGPTGYTHEDPRAALLNARNEAGQTALALLVEDPGLTDAAIRLIPVLMAGESRPLASGQTIMTHLPPFWAALQHPDERVARTMWDSRGQRVSHPLYLAVNEGCDAIVQRRLLAWGVPVDQPTPVGETALFAVLRTWSTARPLSLLDPLLAAGADPRIRNRDGISPLAYARGRVNDHHTLEPVVERLYKLAQHLDERDALNRTATQAVTTARHEESPRDPTFDATPRRRRL